MRVAMASCLFSLEILAHLIGTTPNETKYALEGLGYSHEITLASNDGAAKAVIERNKNATMVAFDLELHDDHPALFIFTWKTETLLVKEGESC